MRENIDRGLPQDSSWKVLIMDRDNFIHIMAKEIVKDIEFQNRAIEILSASSTSQAFDILSQNDDIALIILDPFAEDANNGFDFIKNIRKIMYNLTSRIIIITDIRNKKLEIETLLNYDINGYEKKTSVLSEKFLTMIISALKSYNDIIHIDNNKKVIGRIALSSTELIEPRSVDEFMDSAFCHLNAVINMCADDCGCGINGIGAIKSSGEDTFYVVAGFGSYSNSINSCIDDILPAQDLNRFKKVYGYKEQTILENRYISHYTSSCGVEGIIFMDMEGEINHNNIDIELLDVFHKNISVAFESLCLNKEIEATQEELLYILGEVTEARSEETGNHVKRVSLYSKILAEEYGLKEDDTRLLTMGAPIHDVGKVAIPDNILMKPGKLDFEEFEVVKTHTTIGYNLLKTSNRKILRSAAIIAHEHHERYDGKGYPRGLRGEEIDIFGRIVCVADVFDALGSPRVYKKAWIMDDILNYFHQERGKHFDPQLVDILFDNLDKFMAVKEKYCDKSLKSMDKLLDNTGID